MTIEIFHIKFLMNSLNLMKKLQSKGFDPRISSDKGQCANHYTVEPSVIAIMDPSLCIIAFAELAELNEFTDSAS